MLKSLITPVFCLILGAGILSTDSIPPEDKESLIALVIGGFFGNLQCRVSNEDYYG